MVCKMGIRAFAARRIAASEIGFSGRIMAPASFLVIVAHAPLKSKTSHAA